MCRHISNTEQVCLHHLQEFTQFSAMSVQPNVVRKLFQSHRQATLKLQNELESLGCKCPPRLIKTMAKHVRRY